jgi:hypothetical protein
LQQQLLQQQQQQARSSSRPPPPSTVKAAAAAENQKRQHKGPSQQGQEHAGEGAGTAPQADTPPYSPFDSEVNFTFKV